MLKTAKAPKNENEAREMLTEIAESIRKQDENLHGSVMAKYGLMELDTTSGNYNDAFRATLGQGKNVITFIAVPACEGTIDTSQMEIRKELEKAFMESFRIPEQEPESELQQTA